MRLFIAADLSDELMDALAQTSADLRASIKGRYCAPDTFHVTLAFLGETPASDVDAIAAALQRACAGHAAATLRLGELGFFGRKKDATLWQGFSDPAPLLGIGEDVRAALKDAGFEFDAKALKPHITLMRHADLSSGMLPMPQTEQGSVSTVTLYQSELSAQGSRYTALATVELEG